MVQGFTNGTFFGGSAGLFIGTSLIGNIVGIDTAPEFTRRSINITNSASPFGFAQFTAGSIVNPGSISITWHYSTQVDYASLFTTGNDILTVQFPRRGVGCGNSVAGVAASWTCQVVLEKLSPKWEFDSQMVITGTFKLSGKPAYTFAA